METERLVFRFAEAIAAVEPKAESLRVELAGRLPRATMSALAVAIATARVFPSMKRAMGHASSCALIDFG